MALLGRFFIEKKLKELLFEVVLWYLWRNVQSVSISQDFCLLLGDKKPQNEEEVARLQKQATEEFIARKNNEIVSEMKAEIEILPPINLVSLILVVVGSYLYNFHKNWYQLEIERHEVNNFSFVGFLLKFSILEWLFKKIIRCPANFGIIPSTYSKIA